MDKKDIKKREETVARYLKYGFIALIAVIVIAVVVVLYTNYTTSYVATVGDEKVTVSEFKFFLKQVRSSMIYDAGIEPNTPEAETFWNTTKIEGENAVDYAKKKALEQAKELKIQVIKAEEEGIKLEKNEVKQLEKNLDEFLSEIENSVGTNAGDSSKEYFGVSLKEAKDIYKQIILARKLAAEKMRRVEVSEDDIEAYYKKYPDRFTNTMFRNDAEEAVWVKHILIRVETPEGASKEGEVTEEEKQQLEKATEEARKKAEDILASVKSGEDFAELAKQYSQDPGSAKYGGDYVFGRNKMAPEFEKAAFDKLSPGEVSDLVKTDFGFHIIKLEENIPEGEPVSLRCAKEYEEFISVVKALKYQEILDKWKSEYSIQLKEPVYNSIK